MWGSYESNQQTPQNQSRNEINNIMNASNEIKLEHFLFFSSRSMNYGIFLEC